MDESRVADEIGLTNSGGASPRGALRAVILTPREIVLDLPVRSVRIPTETGQVGFRPRAEPCVLAFEPGLVLLEPARPSAGPPLEAPPHLAGTAGGLLRCERGQVELLTPLAVVGEDRRQVLQALDEALAEPRAEWDARARLGRLEHQILVEFGGRGSATERSRGE